MDLDSLMNKSQWLRKELFEMVVRSRKGHYPSSSSITEIVIALFYGGFLKFDPKNPMATDRDRLFISKGHAGMAIYPILADLGFVPKEEVANFTKKGCVFRFYPDPSIPGIEAITGSLGHGMGIGAGHAIAAKRDGRKYKTYVIISDGECYEGSTWETAMFAAHQELDNLIVIVDRNGCCILDHTENCVRQEPFVDKWKAFGWHTLVVDGHAYKQIVHALKQVNSGQIKNRPIAIISESVKGKGISFMENKPGWHNRLPTEEQIVQAREELETNCIHH